MAKKQKKTSMNRENRSPLMKMKLNQEIKAIELLLPEGELQAASTRKAGCGVSGFKKTGRKGNKH